MCTYCGCQSLTAIKELTEEHDTVVDLAGRVTLAHRAGDIALMAELARRISAVLAPHNEVEEHAFFPPMAAEFPDYIATLEDEHRLIHDVLEQAAGGVPADPGWPAALVDTLALLREHILKEQDGLFPMSLTILSPEQWDELDSVRAGFVDARARQVVHGAT